ncbi:DivIVA domain-containing protein [Nocardia sp. NPDC056611]|uniref:DivIVA domain-containing protein n=1 Tax=Nocardia sp. NPDC056611 TaxID=3345877 RepID=UPI0036734EF6
MYRVFEALDELVAIIEEARGIPPTRNCIVPRGEVLELLDDVREALPGELDDAQDVLDHRDKIVTDARTGAETTVKTANDQAHHTVSSAREEADRILADAKAHADRMVAEARAHADHLVASAEEEAERTVSDGKKEYDSLTGRARAEADRLAAAGQASYDRSVADGKAEQDRLVSQTEVVRAAHTESARLIDTAQADSDRLRSECDDYVDGKLADFEETLHNTLRIIGRGRHQVRSDSSVPDYASEFRTESPGFRR